jgi:SAM-dependent methyltransferase
MDFSEAALIGAQNYKHLKNLYFVRGDIADTGIKVNSIDYVSCDQVIHHTEHPEKTFAHLTSITKKGGEFACYVYAKKAMPRELLDDHFREYAKTLSKEELWELSEQLTQLGKNLSDLNVKFKSPDIPALGIKGGEYDIQRFIYWNFLKCFWNAELGYETSKATNFDWYSPSNAARYTEAEYKKIITDNNLGITYFHKEEACYSGRFKK